jgi:hypothetical protein
MTNIFYIIDRIIYLFKIIQEQIYKIVFKNLFFRMGIINPAHIALNRIAV